MKFKLLSLFLIGTVSSQIVYEHFYPYGSENDDQTLPYSTSQSAIALEVPIVFMETSKDEIYLSHNGIVGIGEKLPEEVKPLSKFPSPAIAVYYAPVSAGNINYRVTTSDHELLKHLTADVKETFQDALDFSALQAVVITWTNIENAERDGPAAFQLVLVSDGLSTYSITHFGSLPWSSSLGYYAQSGFVHSLGKYQPSVNSGGPDVKELVNLSNNEMGSSFYYRISNSAVEDPAENGEEYDYNNYDQDYDKETPGDCPKDDHIDNCPANCNVIKDKRGCSRCLCPDAPIREPNLNAVDDDDSSESDDDVVDGPVQEQHQTCASRTEDSCHRNSLCQDFDAGFCCKCDTGFFGNGYECIPKSDPQRISGSFEGVINGISIDQTDLHTFVTPTDGNVYTAVSKIPSDLGPTMLILNPIGSIMGWLFAYVQSPYVYNGFQLTGGQFNRTVTMHVGSNHYVTIKHDFTGRDIYQYFKSHVFVSGTLPDIAPGSEVIFPDYEEEYKRERSGLVTSYHAMDVRIVDGASSEVVRVTIDQQIHFKECVHREFDRDTTTELQVKRVNPTYNADEGILRFGSRNYVTRKIASRGERVTPSPGSVFDKRRQHGTLQQVSDAPIQIPSGDFCESGQHTCTLPNMKCRIVDPSYRCECEPGFQAAHEATSPIGWHCVDLDECQRGDHSCDQHAVCTNTDGSFTCQCQPGFVGDGHTCIRADNGHPVAQAAPITQIGAGADGTCSAHNQCHQWGECVFTADHPTGRCKCRGWYVGDGVKHCGPPGEKPEQQNANIPQKGGKPCGTSVCDVNAECMPEPSGGSECVCKAGYAGNGITCESLLEEVQIPRNNQPEVIGTVCRAHSECSEYGTCAYHHQLGYYQCTCREPYIGNGVECSLPGSQPQQEEPGCDVAKNCHEFADCVYERTAEGATFKCVCRSGYTGDGKFCIQSQLVISGISPALPQPAPYPEPQPPANAPGCDTLHNCGLNAQCVYDDHNRRYSCECHQGYIGDGINCVSLSSDQSGTDQVNYESHPAQPKTCVETTDCHVNGHCVINENGAGEYICECLPGYRGDGFFNCTGSDECNPSNPHACPQNAQCAFDTQRNAYACQCVPGFKGNGHSCFPYAQPTTCLENPRICHANAECVSRPETNSHACICKPGSIGDGYASCDVIETPRCGNCSVNAHCAQSSTSGGYMCKCNVGFNGNGYVCAPMSSCFDDRNICDVNADCVPGEGGHYVCNCHYGYHGDGHACNPDETTSSRDQLLIARGMAIFQRSIKPESFGKQLIVIPHHIPVGIDYDCKEENIVWSDVTGHSIRTSALDGTDQKSFFAKDLNSPEGIAVDWSSRNVYYADSIDDEIGVLSLDGKYKKVLLSEDLVNPRAIALDLYSRHLYYTDWNRDKPYIGRMDLDGQNNRIFLNEDVHLPNWITILPNRRELCWVDAGNKRLSCIGLNGAGRRTVYSNLLHPFGLTHNNEEKFYWTDWQDNRIHSIGIYGEGYGSFQISLGGSGKVYGILGVPKSCSGAPTPCGENNGGCDYLCLPGQSGAQCVCPDNAKVKGC